MPAIQPAELWQESGRWQRYGKELLRIKDRHDRDFCFGPTHEEVITDSCAATSTSYRQLPVNLYQIQTKFRDEIRPRFGLMRGREFLMKDAYSFDADRAGRSTRPTRRCATATAAIFERCRLDYALVEADTGTIGGSASARVHGRRRDRRGRGRALRRPAATARTSRRRETRRRGRAVAARRRSSRRRQEVATPGQDARSRRSRSSSASRPQQLVKTLIYETEKAARGGAGPRRPRGQRGQARQRASDVAAPGAGAPRRRSREATGAPVGFAGPVGLHEERPRGRRPSRCAALAELRLRRQRGRRPPRRASTGGATSTLAGVRATSCWWRRATPARAAAARWSVVARHRGRPHLQARHQVLRGAGLRLHRRGRAATSR